MAPRGAQHPCGCWPGMVEDTALSVGSSSAEDARAAVDRQMVPVALVFVNQFQLAAVLFFPFLSQPPGIWELSLPDGKDEQLTLFLQLPCDACKCRIRHWYKNLPPLEGSAARLPS